LTKTRIILQFCIFFLEMSNIRFIFVLIRFYAFSRAVFAFLPAQLLALHFHL
jgi:hypothetical protein